MTGTAQELDAGNPDIVRRRKRSRETVPLTVAPEAGAVTETLGRRVDEEATTVSCGRRRH